MASLFALAWGCCAVIDMTATLYLWVGGDARALGLGLLVLAAAVATLLRRTTARLAALSSLWALHILYHFPLVPNHNVALAGMNLAIAVTTLALIARRRTLAVPLADAHDGYAGVVRLHLVLIYGLAALHKLNWDYLDPQVSCASMMARGIAAKLGLPASGLVDVVAIWSSLALELGLPVLLWLRGTRRLGLALGLPFHFVLSLDSVVPILGFSAAIYSAYVLFLPAPAAARILALEWLPGSRRARAGVIAALVVAGAALALACGARGGAEERMFLLPPPALTIPAAVVVGGGLVLRTAWHVLAGLALLGLARVRVPAAPLPARRAHPALLVLPALVLVNGLGPYLGLKTVPTFSMFSNLMTDGGRSNHLFLAPLRPRSREDELVEIVDSSSARLRAVARAHVRITYFELRRLLSGETPEVSAFLVGGVDEAAAPGFWVDYRRDGATVHVARAATPGAEVFRPHDWMTARLVAYRLMPRGDRPMTCVW